MRWRTSLALFAILCMTACGSPGTTVLKPEVGVSISSLTRINARRDVADVRVANTSSYDLFCPVVTARVIFDDPDSYLEKGEQVHSDFSVFLRPGESRSSRITTAGQGHVDIRNAVVLEGGQSCRRAALLDYCDADVRDQREAALVQWLQKKYGARSCAELNDSVSGKTLDLRGAPELMLRPLIYLTRANKILARSGDEKFVADVAAAQNVYREVSK